jgi:Protein of unknown function (DUF2786)
MSDILERVRALILKAEHPETPAPEAKACREKADAIMFKYRIDQAMLEAEKPSAERQKPKKIKVDIGPSGNPLGSYFASLGNAVAEHTRCSIVWLRRANPDTEWMAGQYGWHDELVVYGFGDDVHYFEMLYTALFLHMSQIFFPKPDPSKSLDENVIYLRRLGMNWLQMAEVYGWSKVREEEFWFGKDKGKEYWRNAETGEVRTNFQIGGYFKRVTHRAYERAGLPLLIIPSVASRRAEKDSYRASVASGYVGEVTARLRAAREGRRAEPGAELVLARDRQAIEEMVSTDYPNLVSTRREEPEFNSEAYSKGIMHGKTADLSTSPRTEGRKAGEIA